MRPTSTLARSLNAVGKEPYVCPSCWLKASVRPGPRAKRVTLPQQSPENRHFSNGSSTARHARPLAFGSPREPSKRSGRQFAKRSASNGSLASVTAINAPSTVPPAYRELHQKLLALQETAGSYVDLSRLQLAVRSLESSTPVVRVALLGLGKNGSQAARKLARALLSDALGQEEDWERELLQNGQDRSLLLKYGDREEVVVQQSPLVQTVAIPSPFLKRHNLEILVTTLNADGRSAHEVSQSELEDAILVPPLSMPNSAGGRVGFVRYPVHKALIVAEGITGAVDYGRLPRFIDKAFLINAALSLPLHSSTGTDSAEEAVTDNVVDIDLATHALKLFRDNNANGAQFSDEWQTSRIPALSEWLAGKQETTNSGMNPAVHKFLDSVILNASASIEKSEFEQSSAAATATAPEAKRLALGKTISDWSADAHRDLQINLNTALSSRTWRRTAWWRLLWRIDDVSVSASDILRLSWLTEAEQSLAYLSGRIAEAGLATPDELKEAGASGRVLTDGVAAEVQSWEPKRAQVMTPADLLQTPTLLSRVQQQSGVNALFDPPWPQTIHLARQQMLHTLVPELHRKAQALLVSTLTTSGGASALAGWLYIATGGDMLYEAGAVAALGVVWSLRRLQRLWGKEREGFATALREDGRRVLAEVESHLRRIVQEGGRVTLNAEDVQSWREARKAVETCREALEKIK